MRTFVFFVLFLVVYGSRKSSASPIQEYGKQIEKCAGEHHLSTDDIVHQLEEKYVHADGNVKCFLKCIADSLNLRKDGTYNEEKFVQVYHYASENVPEYLRECDSKLKEIVTQQPQQQMNDCERVYIFHKCFEELLMNPIILIADYHRELYYDNTEVAVCLTPADSFWSAFYFIGCITLFFAVPFVVLVLLYTAIAWKLLRRNTDFHRPTSPMPQHMAATLAVSGGVVGARPLRAKAAVQPSHHQLSSGMRKHRKQVIFMLITVVASFFICLLPFRVLTVWIIASDPEDGAALGLEGFYNVLYFCRIMLYLNSGLNPILYNLMSSKFRTGFWRLITSCCGRTQHVRYTTASQRRPTEGVLHVSEKSGRTLRREATFLVNSISTSSSTERTSWRSSSMSATASSGLPRVPEKGVTKVGAAIIDITSGTVTSACLYGSRSKEQGGGGVSGGTC